MLARISAVQAQHGCVTVDGGVPGGEAHVLRPQLAAECHPLLVTRALIGQVVDGAPPASEGGEVQGGGDERLAGAGGRVQDDVPPLEELENGLLLRRVEGQALAGDVLEKAPEELVARRLVAGQEVVEGTGHERVLWADSSSRGTAGGMRPPPDGGPRGTRQGFLRQ